MTQPILFQRLESATIFVVIVWSYHLLGFNWWLWLGWILIDLSAFGYLINAQTGAWTYNLGHNYIYPAILILMGYHNALSLAIGLIWASHVALDRLLGYGLKESSDFGDTHLGRIGKH